MNNGVMEYREDDAANAIRLCALCGTPVDAYGEAVNQPEDHTEREYGALAAIGFLGRLAEDDPRACLCMLLSLQQTAPSCRKIAEATGWSKSTVNEAQAAVEKYIPEMAGICGRQTASALAQRARRAKEMINRPDPRQTEMFEK